MIVGTVREIWRYPVKSMGGGRLERCHVGPRGIPGDRGYALRDEQAREIRGAKKMPELLRCSARYLGEPAEDRIPPVEITLPDGFRIKSTDATVSDRLSEVCRRRVTLHALRPADDLEHYRRRLPEDPAQVTADLREMFGRLGDEPLPDVAQFPQEILEFTSPRGTYFDAFPIHLLTTAWLGVLAESNCEARFDRRRFRPNFLIETRERDAQTVELEWCGHELRVGDVSLRVEMPTVRCVMTTLPQGDLPKDPSVLRTIVRDSDQNVGVYCSVVGGGRVAVGDSVELR